MSDIEQLLAGIQQGDRHVLARAITLVESRRPQDVLEAQRLLAALPEPPKATTRVGITGVPGVGKSTLIDVMGSHLTTQGHRVAVLAVDPSSTVTGGSILGDKTRMQRLSNDDAAFVRPSPGGGAPGGIAQRTREALVLCESAGYDVVLIETIGVGQSEIAVSRMVDCFVLMLLPGAGDELQGIKRGIVELADVVLVNKADGDLRNAADIAKADYITALQLLHAHSAPPVLLTSAKNGDGIAEAWSSIRSVLDARGAADREERRATQRQWWFEDALQERLSERFFARASVQAALPQLQEQVRAGDLPPGAAVQQLLDQE